MEAPTVDLPVLRDWGDVVAILKPTSLPSEAGGTGPSALSLVRSQLQWPEARLPHRLDAPTSGILVAARDALAAERVNADIRAKAWRKFYVARVCGDASAFLGVQRCYLKAGRGRSAGPRHLARRAEVVRSGGDPCSLEILHAAFKASAQSTRLVIELHTGRYHQIRAMCAWRGHPLVGDELYGGRTGELSLVHATLSLPTLAAASSTGAGRNTEVISVEVGTHGVTAQDLSIISQRLASATSGRL